MKKGFTLAETMGVIILLGLIAAVTVPFIDGYIKDSKEKTKKNNINKIVDAAKNWNMKYGYTKECSEKTCYITVDELKNTEFLANQNIIDPETKKDLDGRVKITKENEKYKYEYEKVEYVYFQSDGEFTSLDQTVETRPTTYNAYLKINKNDITNVQACMYSDGKELCLSPNEYEKSKQKIFNYFGFSESTWTQNETEWTKDGKTCNIDATFLTYTYTECYDFVVDAYVYLDGIVYAYDKSARFECSMDVDGSARCDK